jgi:putative heme-binding domain-containing protein
MSCRLLLRRLATFVLMSIFSTAFAFAVVEASRADDAAEGLESLASLLVQVDDASLQKSLLAGMHQALAGRRGVAMPPSWPKAYEKLSHSSDQQVRERALALALVFGDPQALAAMRKVALDRRAPSEDRNAAIGLLVQSNAPDFAPALQRLLDDEQVRAAALRGLAAYAHPKTAELILNRYESLSTEERREALTTLAARPEFAAALLDAVDSGKIEASDIPAYTARQIEGLGKPEIVERLRRLWGVVRQTSKERRALIARYKKSLDDELLKKADLQSGKQLFEKTCAQCHKLFGKGGEIGPDITGSNRSNLDYILENVVDPSATVARAYKVVTFALDDGRVLSGIITRETARTVTVQTVNEQVVLDRSAIVEQAASDKSMMPDGLLDKLSADDVRDLVAYLKRMRDEG